MSPSWSKPCLEVSPAWGLISKCGLIPGKTFLIPFSGLISEQWLIPAWMLSLAELTQGAEPSLGAKCSPAQPSLGGEPRQPELLFLPVHPWGGCQPSPAQPTRIRGPPRREGAPCPAQRGRIMPGLFALGASRPSSSVPSLFYLMCRNWFFFLGHCFRWIG